MDKHHVEYDSGPLKLLVDGKVIEVYTDKEDFGTQVVGLDEQKLHNKPIKKEKPKHSLATQVVLQSLAEKRAEEKKELLKKGGGYRRISLPGE